MVHIMFTQLRPVSDDAMLHTLATCTVLALLVVGVEPI